MRLRVWWSTGPKPGNLGDVLTPHILAALGHQPVLSAQGRADMIATGSVIRFARSGQSVWGSGVMWGHDRPDPRVRYLAVRGPLTRKAVLAAGGECPEVYGDPALTLPEFVNGSVRPRYDVGFVPHYVDRKRVAHLHPDEHRIDVLRANPLDVVAEIRECRTILSSSLHGIIVAHAFGIPAAWVRWSDGLDGDDVKFADYAASVGIELVPYASAEEAVPVLPDDFDVSPLIEALP